MLIIKRGVGESIRINDNVLISVKGIRLEDGKVDLVIEAPKEVTITRQEPSRYPKIHDGGVS